MAVERPAVDSATPESARTSAAVDSLAPPQGNASSSLGPHAKNGKLYQPDPADPDRVVIRCPSTGMPRSILLPTKVKRKVEYLLSQRDRDVINFLIHGVKEGVWRERVTKAVLYPPRQVRPALGCPGKWDRYIIEIRRAPWIYFGKSERRFFRQKRHRTRRNSAASIPDKNS